MNSSKINILKGCFPKLLPFSSCLGFPFSCHPARKLRLYSPTLPVTMPNSRMTEGREGRGRINEDSQHSLEITTPLIKEEGSAVHFKPVPIGVAASTAITATAATGFKRLGQMRTEKRTANKNERNKMGRTFSESWKTPFPQQL